MCVSDTQQIQIRVIMANTLAKAITINGGMLVGSTYADTCNNIMDKVDSMQYIYIHQITFKHLCILWKPSISQPLTGRLGHKL